MKCDNPQIINYNNKTSTCLKYFLRKIFKNFSLVKILKKTYSHVIGARA